MKLNVLKKRIVYCIQWLECCEVAGAYFDPEIISALFKLKRDCSAVCFGCKIHLQASGMKLHLLVVK